MQSPTNKSELLRMVDDFLRRKFVYVDEKIETIQTPDYMLTGLEMSGILAGDCDDISTLHAALLTALGFVVRFVAIRSIQDSTAFDHVYIEVQNNNRWIMYDITLPLETQINYFGRIAIEV